ncbi:hypothetical protein AB0B15_42965 [Streptomyces sp. NPDC045456]|uniref:hypothetical protein n=1 Tax=Streptomyces sp. NPDC045456 TaxID=3155254 RepID=UPI0033DB7277
MAADDRTTLDQCADDYRRAQEERAARAAAAREQLGQARTDGNASASDRGVTR